MKQHEKFLAKMIISDKNSAGVEISGVKMGISSVQRLSDQTTHTTVAVVLL